MIGIRRLELIPKPHVFEIGFRIYKDLIPTDLVFNDDWILIETHNMGTYQHPNMIIGPTFVDENDFPDDENEYTSRPSGDDGVHWITDAYMYMIKFADGRVYYKKSDEKVEIIFTEIFPLKFAILEENNMLEILQVIVKTLGEVLNADLLYGYDPASGYLDL
jgi:hypothetical protein